MATFETVTAHPSPRHFLANILALFPPPPWFLLSLYFYILISLFCVLLLWESHNTRDFYFCHCCICYMNRIPSGFAKSQLMGLGINKGKTPHPISGLKSSCGSHPKSKHWSQLSTKLHPLGWPLVLLVKSSSDGSWTAGRVLLSESVIAEGQTREHKCQDSCRGSCLSL